MLNLSSSPIAASRPIDTINQKDVPPKQLLIFGFRAQFYVGYRNEGHFHLELLR